MNPRARGIRKLVRHGYSRIARTGASCCPGSSCCAGPSACQGSARDMSRRAGYSDREMRSVPPGADMGLGCGTPVALASLKRGEVVLDLGSGGGFDAFLAARRVGPKGQVIGVDMTAAMVGKARRNARKAGLRNVEFRRGEIEGLPLKDRSVDAVISNCVMNLSPDKARAFAEAFRVLKPGGRLMVSDLVLTGPIPPRVRKSAEAYVACVGGAVGKAEYLRLVKSAGFRNVKVLRCVSYPVAMGSPYSCAGNGGRRPRLLPVASISLSAGKPPSACSCGSRGCCC